MIIPTKKLNNGFEIPVLGLGTARLIGEKDTEAKSNDNFDVKAIRTAIELGLNHIDTAELYGEGHAERLVKKAILGIDRNKLFITSKVHSPHQSYRGVIKAATASLRRIGIDHFDLYLIHQPDFQVPIKETIKAMDFLVDTGMTKYIGLSNFKKERLIEAQAFASHKLVCDQVHYNLEIREVQKDGLLDYCQSNDVILSAWRSLQKGNFLNKKVEIIEEICEKYEKTPAQVALNWLLCQSNVIAIFKTRHLNHLLDNLGSIGWKINVEDLKRLSIEFPNQQAISDRFPLP